MSIEIVGIFKPIQTIFNYLNKMVNLKYPAALKGKASMGWLGGIVAGFCPIFYYYLGSASNEFHGHNKRYCRTETMFWIYLMSSDYNQTVRSREFLDLNPTIPLSKIDKMRLLTETMNYHSFK